MEIKLEVNGQAVSVRTGATVMEAIRKLDLYVPHFCYHEKLSIAANCRMCMVDVEKSPKAVPACATPAVDGMVVRTDSERARKAQHGVMEFLLINHPLDCPICDQGGECQLQDLAVGYGVSRSRYREEKRVVFEKNLGPLVATDMTRCIHCTRCVRFGREVAGIMELGMTGRGEHAEIMPFVEKTVASELSGNIIDLCPVGALTSKPFRYSARPWELATHASVATHDSWGSHLALQTKGGAVKRVLPSRAPGIHEHWISDRDRFSYEGLHAPDRALAPMTRDSGGKMLKETPWKGAVSMAAQRLQDICRKHGSESVGFFVSPRATSEEALLVRRIADHLGCKNIDSRLQQRHFDGGDISGFGLPLAELGSVPNILFIGAEPARELPLLAAMLRQKKRKKKIFSIAAQDIAAQLPQAQQIVVSPLHFNAVLEQLLAAAGAALPEGYASAGKAPPADAGGISVEKIAEQLKKQKTAIWLGDSARAAPHYGATAALAAQLAQHLGCPLGTLADGGNGAGVRRAGALPVEDGLHTSAMLNAGLRAAVLLRCEKADFAEHALAQKTLDKADFVCAISSYSGGFRNCATVLLPAAEFSETDGTYINGSGEATVAVAAAPPPGKARPAWKILRLLGEYLAIPDFDFTTLAPVRQWLEDSSHPATAPLPLKPAAAASSAATFCLHGGIPLYGSDMLVRRATALQKTPQSKAAQLLHLHPADIAQQRLAAGGRVLVSDSAGNHEEAILAAEAALARGTMRYHPKALLDASGLGIAAAEEKEAV